MIGNRYFSPDAVIKNSLFGSNVRIYKQAEIKNSQIGGYVSIGDDAIIRDSKINDNVEINRRNFISNANVGSYTYTGIGTIILSADIGRFCSISWNISIGGGEHEYKNVSSGRLWRFHFLDTGKLVNKVGYEHQKSCTVGNDVWIASNAVVLRNVKIGNGAVIGAGAVVTKDVEPYSIVAGVPARVIKKRFDERAVEALQQIKWWNWPNETIRNNLELIYSTVVNSDVIEKLREISVKVNTL